MSKKPRKPRPGVGTFSGSPSVIDYIREEAHKKRRTFSGEVMELLERGIAERDGEPALHGLVGDEKRDEA